MFKQAALSAVMACNLALSGCATDRYDSSANRALTGAAIGAAGGAVVGAVTGITPVLGATVGATAGAVVGSVIKGPLIKRRKLYRDSRGYCYYFDRDGQPVYDYKARC